MGFAPLRGLLAGFFKVIMLNPDAPVQIIACLALSAALAAAGLAAFKRKAL